MPDIVEIDGSEGEGGGQILRTALGLSVVTGRPVRIVRVRAHRPKPGLAAQHLAGVKALARLCRGEVEGAAIGGSELLFAPGGSMKSEMEVEVGTAGSVTLVLQGLLIALARAPKRVRLTAKGGTDVAWSPPFFYFAHVLVPLLSRMGFAVQARLVRAGFYPRGGGEVEVVVRPPSTPAPLTLAERGEPGPLAAHCLASEDLEKAKVAERLAAGVRYLLPTVKTVRHYSRTHSTGASVVVSAHFGNTVLGADTLGERGVRAEEIGRRAGERLLSTLASGATVDEWASDQILPFLALAGGESIIIAPALTPHARTNISIIRRFLPAGFEVEEGGKAAVIRCRGAG